MAGIDKIYGTQKQYHELRSWLRIWYPNGIKYLFPARGGFNKNHRPISNFPNSVDEWLLKKCPIEWVTDRIN
jgi:hypothetical protein